jgi:hypothetical protein
MANATYGIYFTVGGKRYGQITTGTVFASHFYPTWTWQYRMLRAAIACMLSGNAMRVWSWNPDPQDDGVYELKTPIQRYNLLQKMIKDSKLTKLRDLADEPR